LAGQFGISSDAFDALGCKACPLPVAGGRDAGPDVQAAFDGRRQHEVGSCHCGNLDVQIDAIHHRA